MTCVGRLPSPPTSPPSPISPMRLSSALFFFTLFPLSDPRYNRYPTPFSLPLINLLGTPHPHPPSSPSPRLSRLSIPTCCCILRKPRSIPYQPVRRAFFSARGEAREHGQRRIDGGVKESRFFFSSFPSCRVARFPMFIADRASSFRRPRLHRHGKWIG